MTELDKIEAEIKEMINRNDANLKTIEQTYLKAIMLAHSWHHNAVLKNCPSQFAFKRVLDSVIQKHLELFNGTKTLKTE